MPNNNAIFWRNLCKILRLCQDIVLSIFEYLILEFVSKFFIRLFLVITEEGIFYKLLPFGKHLMKPCDETLYYIFFQSHCLCSIKKVCQTDFCFLSRKSKCQFFFVLGISVKMPARTSLRYISACLIASLLLSIHN